MKYYGKITDDKDLVTKEKSEQIAQAEISAAIDPSSGTVQAKLVSGTNIKTINGSSILGSGNVDIDALPSQSEHSGEYLTTNGSSASWGEIPQEVYRCTYNTTTFSQIQSALANGKLPYCIVQNNLFWYLSFNQDKYQFTTTYLHDVYIISVDTSNAWTLESKSNQKTADRVTSLTSSSTDTQYPSAKCVYDAIPASISAAGSATRPVYISATDVATPCTYGFGIDSTGPYIESF